MKFQRLGHSTYFLNLPDDKNRHVATSTFFPIYSFFTTAVVLFAVEVNHRVSPLITTATGFFMSIRLGPSGEENDHKLAAVFKNYEAAQRAEQQLAETITLDAGQMDILDPGTKNISSRLLPENHGMWRTWIRAHAVFGAVGAVLGVIAFLALVAADVTFIANNKLFAGIVFVHVFTLSGLLAGGLFALRPDQNGYIYATKSALRSGQAVLLVHARTSDQLNAARRYLNRPALELIRSA